MSKQRAGKRNERHWLEDDDMCVLDKSGIPTLVRIRNMRGDTKEGEVIYGVEEMVSRQCYPASSCSLRKVRDLAEVDALLVKQPKLARTQGETT